MAIIKSLTFFGSSKPKKSDKLFKQAYSIAGAVTKKGYRVINGGGPGIMLAATLGAKDAGGRPAVVYYKPELATKFEGKCAFNFAKEHYEEANYVLRVKKLLELGDTYICFNGGTGTISEFGMAWGLARLYFGHHKPLILYGDFWLDIMKTFKKNMMAREEEYKVFTIVNTPQGVLEAIAQFEIMIRLNRHAYDPKKAKAGERFLML